MISRPAVSAVLALSIALGAAPAAAQAPAPTGSPYRALPRTVTGGDGGGDYLIVDGAGGRVVMARGSHVVVVDLRGDSLAGGIAAAPGVHGIAIAAELGKRFPSSGRDSTVAIFDLRTPASTGSVEFTGPDAIPYSPASRRVFTFDGGSATTTGAAGGTVAGTVPLPGRPEAAVLDGAGHVWVNTEDMGGVQAFDARALRGLGHRALAGCEEPGGLAVGRLFSVCGNGKIAVTHIPTHRMVAMAIGNGAVGAAFEPSTGMAFSSIGDGTMPVRQDMLGRYRVVQTLPTQRGARILAPAPASYRLYSVSAGLGAWPAFTAENPRPRWSVVLGSGVPARGRRRRRRTARAAERRCSRRATCTSPPGSRRHGGGGPARPARSRKRCRASRSSRTASCPEGPWAPACWARPGPRCSAGWCTARGGSRETATWRVWGCTRPRRCSSAT
jgi:hypothetical protein